jgi:uncharacterized damage-inducible protein DinB
MYRKLDDFLQAYAQLNASTLKVLQPMTNADASRRVAPGHRALGEIAWHIVASVPEMMGRTGLTLASVDPGSPPPADAERLRAGYETVTGELLAAVRDRWNDETLTQVDDMYGQKWPRGLSLAILVQHEVHHVGQMTVLLRQAGRIVPGTHGPAKEEWTQFGMNPPAY